MMIVFFRPPKPKDFPVCSLLVAIFPIKTICNAIKSDIK